ncbi:hypothetical protein ANRL1_02617 [Anaerolineae bacterium]|nr:hypothetical protein ANRL1_02617 [Anaerolineae bacterium]
METLYWLIDTQTFGGMVVLTVFCAVLVLYFFMLRWIAAGAKEDL